jgi:hypothetical protein
MIDRTTKCILWRATKLYFSDQWRLPGPNQGILVPGSWRYACICLPGDLHVNEPTTEQTMVADVFESVVVSMIFDSQAAVDQEGPS